jgi:regulator of replication initiation timing
MSALDTVKELGRMATTATLTKDVIDLFSQKVELLEKQVATLQQENAALKTENANLKAKLYDLEQELNRAKPKRDLADDTTKVLRLFFDHDLAASQVANALSMSHGMGDYHCGVLYEKGMIALPMIRTMGAENVYYITQTGRDYIVKHGLA